MATIQALRMIKARVRLGRRLDRVAGSHHILTKPGHTPVTVAVRRGATMKEGTARSTLRHTGIGEEQFFDVY